MSKDRLSVLRQIYGSAKRQTEAVRNECLLEKCVQIVISAFSCSAEDVHFVTFFPYGQAMAFKNSVISAELTNYVCNVILHWAFYNRLL